MQGQYELRIVSEYLNNLLSRTSRSSPISFSVVEWAVYKGTILGIDFDNRVLDKTFWERHRHNSREPRRVWVEEWEQLNAAVSTARRRYQRAKPTIYDQNLVSVADYFGLNTVERRILDMVCRYRIEGPFEELCNDILEDSPFYAADLIALFLGVAKKEVFRRIAASGRLIRSGLLTVDPVDHGFDATYEKRPAGPHNDRRAQDEFDPKGHPLAQNFTDGAQPHIGAHRQHQKRNRQHGANPKAAREIDELRVRSFVGGRDPHRLKGHAADRTVARFVAHDFRVHWAGVFGALGQALALPLVRPGDKKLRIGDELVVTPLRTEVIGLALVLPLRFARIQWHGHPANRVFDRHSIGRNRCMAMMMTGILMIMLVHGLTPASRFRWRPLKRCSGSARVSSALIPSAGNKTHSILRPSGGRPHHLRERPPDGL